MAVATTPPAVSSLTTKTVSSISARELHEALLRSHAMGNVARRRFIDALHALAEGKLYLELGFSDIVGYAEATFRYKRSQTYEFLRVSEAFDGLPKIAHSFELGELSWSLVVELTRVATSDTEREWLEIALTHRVAETLAEVQDALRKKRDRPRKNRNGLPGLPVRQVYEFSPEEHAIVGRAMEKVASEMSKALNGKRPEPEKVLLYLSDRILHTEPEGDVTSGREERVDSPYTVVFHSCPECLRASVETSQGRVEISTEAVERVVGGAKQVEIEPDKEVPPGGATSEETVPPGERDRPNPPRLRRELCARAGGRCENPYCRRETPESEGHGHHLRLRSEGGATALWNEIWTCKTCHATLHAGCLTVTGDPLTGLTWTPRAMDVTRHIREELERTRTLPEVRAVRRFLSGPPDKNPSGPPDKRGQSAAPAAPVDEETEEMIEDVLAGLRGLGWTKEQAKIRTNRAYARLMEESSEPIDTQRLLLASIRGRTGATATDRKERSWSKVKG